MPFNVSSTSRVLPVGLSSASAAGARDAAKLVSGRTVSVRFNWGENRAMEGVGMDKTELYCLPGEGEKASSGKLRVESMVASLPSPASVVVVSSLGLRYWEGSPDSNPADSLDSIPADNLDSIPTPGEAEALTEGLTGAVVPVGVVETHGKYGGRD